MKRNPINSASLLLLVTARTSAGTYSNNIVGYFNCNFMAGSNLFNNPLQAQSNNISFLFPRYPNSAYDTPEGTTISLWNPTTASFDATSTYTNGYWSIDLILPPGTGALVVAPSAFTNTIVGYTLDHDGSTLTNEYLTPPPVFSGPNGTYLLGDKSPVADIGTNIFINILGRMPFVGEQVTQLSGTSTYLGNGMWDSVPTLNVGNAAFLNIVTEQPWLTIVYTNEQAIVSWPSMVSGWTLQTNDNLTTSAWRDYLGPIVNNTVTNSLPAGDLFFRLSSQ
jgi:hypothetical protein